MSHTARVGRRARRPAPRNPPLSLFCFFFLPPFLPPPTSPPPASPSRCFTLHPMNPFFGAHARSTLHGWFSSYSRDPRIEIESRVRGVNKQGFEAVLERLREGPWTAREAETLDRMHASGVRETIELASGKRTFLRKAKHAQPITIEISAEFAVRFALASEVECPPDDSRVISYRHKRRTSFVHKGMFAFELTRVNQGASKAQAQNSPLLYEIELEFCGQQLGDALPNPGYLTDSMLMKARPRSHPLTVSLALMLANPSP